MKRHIMLLTSAALLMLAGCFRNPTAESVQTAESAAPEGIAEVRTTWEASTTPDGEPVISDYQGTFYRRMAFDADCRNYSMCGTDPVYYLGVW